MVVNSDSSSNNMTSSSSSNSSVAPGITPGVAHACLICRPNSHPFNDRTLTLDNPVKVGRSVARARATQSNAIFDCKVLSRNHALLWYEAGKFYLQDTKSSNGTFVNNQRLSKGGDESPPREVCSGDILQFGVDVMENSRKVTHGCIIATLTLYLPDGKEAKASPTIVNSTNNSAMLSLSLPTQDLYQLNQYIQEALAREQLLETKLAVLQRLVGQTETASSDAWKSLIDEDRLLTRVEILESQLSTYGKSMNEDKLRDETKKLMEEKGEYQERTKDTLKRLMNEKLEAVKKVQELENSLSSTEDEFATLKELYEKNIDESNKLATELNRLSQDLEAAKAKIPPTVEELPEEIKEESEIKLASETGNDVQAGAADETVASTEDQPAELATEATFDTVQSQDTMSNEDNESISTSTTTLDISSALSDMDDAPDEDQQRLNELTDKLANLETELTDIQRNNEVLKETNKNINAELGIAQEQLCEALKLLDEKCRLLEDTSNKIEDATTRAEASEEIAKLSQEKEEICSENERLRADLAAHLQVIEDYEQKQMAASSSSTLVGSVVHNIRPNEDLEKSLMEAEAKISELLKVKEKYAEVSAEKSTLAINLSELQQEMNLMSLQTKTATTCAIIPIIVIVLAMLASYIPFFGSSAKVE